MSDAHDLTAEPLHLGLGATARVLGDFDGSPGWFARYSADVATDGAEGRLVTMHTFDEAWDSWEVHPTGDEVVLCISGSLTLHQEAPDGTSGTVVLGPGQYAVNGPGVWHTADAAPATTALFITAGQGTDHRPR